MPDSKTDLAVTQKSVADVVADRIRATFVELIPPEQFKALVNREIQWFITASANTYHDARSFSPLQRLIQQELESKFKAMLKDELHRPEYVEQYENDKLRPGEAVRQIIRDHLVEIAESAFGRMVVDIVQQIRNAR